MGGGTSIKLNIFTLQQTHKKGANYGEHDEYKRFNEGNKNSN